MKQLKIIFSLCLVATLAGCVTPVPVKDQAPTALYTPSDALLISVVDERDRVASGKDETFVGKAHGVFGIPADWHVDPVLAVEEGDDERTLAQLLEHRMVTGLKGSGWGVMPAGLTERPSDSAIKELMLQKQVDKLFLLVLNEWYFSVNLNWVSAFNFDTDADIYVYEVSGNKLLSKNIAGRDVVEESADESYQNLILQAYRDQLAEIINDAQVVKALMISD